jgi:hypothetical protein
MVGLYCFLHGVCRQIDLIHQDDIVSWLYSTLKAMVTLHVPVIGLLDNLGIDDQTWERLALQPWMWALFRGIEPRRSPLNDANKQ